MTNPTSSPRIDVNLQKVRYQDGDRLLELPASWVYADTPSGVDVNILFGDELRWTIPADEPIDPATRELILNQLAMRFSVAPKADIVAPSGALLRGVSAFKFYRQGHPGCSRYYEPGRFLAIPMAPTDPAARPRFVLDVSSIQAWTAPKIPLPRAQLEAIVARVLAGQTNLGVHGL